MLVTCPTCGLSYNDTNHSTVCPHYYFPMRTICGKINPATGKYEEMLCTTPQQVDQFISDSHKEN